MQSRELLSEIGAFWNSRSPNIYFSNRKDSSVMEGMTWHRESRIIITQIPPDKLIAVWHEVWCIYSITVLLILPLATVSLRRQGGFLTSQKLVWICVSLSHQISPLVVMEGFDKRVMRSKLQRSSVCFIPAFVCTCVCVLVCVFMPYCSISYASYLVTLNKRV